MARAGPATSTSPALLRRSLEGRERTQSHLAGDDRVVSRAVARGVQLVDVMIAAQKARVSFETLTQVRNKMVAAYKDIMSTPL